MLKFILPFLLCVCASAQDTPISSAYNDFSGGLNNYTPSIYLDKSESPDMMNVDIDNPVGALKQRSGYLTCGTTPSGNTATAMFEYSKSDGSRHLILSDNVSVWQTDDCIVFSTVVTGLSSLSVPYFKTVRDKVWIVNGSAYPVTWDGTTATFLDGTGTKPKAPIGNYIEFWKERVWIGRINTDPSGVIFSELTDTSGNILDPSVSSMAWANTLNEVYFDREGGSPIYWLRAYRDNLFVGKDNGIFRLLFESDLNLSLTKTVSNIGCKFQDTIVEMDDGLLYMACNDGIYAFDGINSKRISDKIQSTFNLLKQPSHNERFKLWDSPTDFISGTLTNTTTNYVSGSIALNFDSSPRLFDNFSDGNYTSNPTWTLADGSNYFSVQKPCTYGCSNMSAALYYITPIGSYHGTLVTSTTTLAFGSWGFNAYAHSRNSTQFTIGQHYEKLTYYFVSDSTDTSSMNGFAVRYNCYESAAYCKNQLIQITGGQETILFSSTTNLGNSLQTALQCGGSTITVTQSGLFSMSNGFKDTFGLGSGCVDYTYQLPTVNITQLNHYQMIRMDVNMVNNTSNIQSEWPFIGNISIPGSFINSGSFTSQQVNNPLLTQWKTFDVDNTLNGQSISYQIKTATSSYNLSILSFSPIVPGAIISTTTNKWVQWKANFTTADNGQSPLLNATQINWSEGDTSISRLVARSFNNRYWLSGSTTPANPYNDMVLVKTRSPLNSWMLYDLKLSAITLWNNNLYGAVSNSGNISRLDYGNNDGGNAIHSWWQSKDEIYGFPVNFKTVNQAIVDYSKSGNNALTMSISFDNGVSWTDRPLDLSGGKYQRNTKVLNYDMPPAINFRTKLENSKLDFGYSIFGMYHYGTASQYKGK